MKTARIPMITKRWLAVILILALLPYIAIAGATATLDQQLIEAAARGELALVKTLLDQGADLNTKDEYGRTALTEAAGRGDLETVRLLLDKGADLNTNASSGWPALTEAAGRGDLETVRLLLDKGAPVDAKDRNGSTALMQAAVHGPKGRPEVVRLLLDKGVDLNAKDKQGWTALMWGVWYSRPGVVEPLLDNGADVNAKDRNGSTALMQAGARDHQLKEKWYNELWNELRWLFRGKVWGPSYPLGANDPQIVKLLLDKGADLNAKDRNGWTALKRAQERGATEIVELLKAHEASNLGKP